MLNGVVEQAQLRSSLSPFLGIGGSNNYASRRSCLHWHLILNILIIVTVSRKISKFAGIRWRLLDGVQSDLITIDQTLLFDNTLPRKYAAG